MRLPHSQTKFQNVVSHYLDLEAACGDEESDVYDDEFYEGNFKVEFFVGCTCSQDVDFINDNEIDKIDLGSTGSLFHIVGLFGNEDLVTIPHSAVREGRLDLESTQIPGERHDNIRTNDDNNEGTSRPSMDPNLINLMQEAANMPWGLPLAHNQARHSV